MTFGESFQRKAWITLLFLATLIFIWGEIKFGAVLIKPDESLYTQISLEMARSHEILVPLLDGHPSFVKPPLVYWLEIAGFRLFGENLWAARLPIWILGLLCLWLVFHLGKLLFSDKVAWGAALFLFSNVFFFQYSQADMMDVPLTFFILLTIDAWIQGCRKNPNWFLVCGVALGMVNLVKGPIGSLLCLGLMMAYCAVEHDWSFLQRKQVWLGLGLALILGSVWPVLLFFKGYGHDWFREFIVEENFGKFGGSRMPVKILLIGLLGGIAPWTFLLLESFWKGIRTWGLSKERAFLLCWIFLVFFLFCIPARKLPHYVLPAIPACCLLIGSMPEFSFLSLIPTRILLVSIGLLWLLGIRLTQSWVVQGLIVIGGLAVFMAALTLKNKSIRLAPLFFGVLLMMLPVAFPAIQYPNQEAQVQGLLASGKNIGVFCPDDHDLRGFELSPRFLSIEKVEKGVDFLRRGGVLVLPKREENLLKPLPFLVQRHWRVWKTGVGLGKVIEAVWSKDLFPLEEEIEAVSIISPSFN